MSTPTQRLSADESKFLTKEALAEFPKPAELPAI
jgi:hypothetical protein